jgi:hypothetical protein
VRAGQPFGAAERAESQRKAEEDRVAEAAAVVGHARDEDDERRRGQPESEHVLRIR